MAPPDHAVKNAYVTTTWHLPQRRYALIVQRGVFRPLNGTEFARFRPAQVIANAINAHEKGKRK